jgi:hypothetical protein
MLGIVRIQPPTGSPYIEPGVVKRMARQLPVVGPATSTGATLVGATGASGLGLHYTQPPLPGSQYPNGQEPWVVAAMARNLPDRFRNFTDIPNHPLAGALGNGFTDRDKRILWSFVGVGVLAVGAWAFWAAAQRA